MNDLAVIAMFAVVFLIVDAWWKSGATKRLMKLEDAVRELNPGLRL